MADRRAADLGLPSTEACLTADLLSWTGPLRAKRVLAPEAPRTPMLRSIAVRICPP